VRRAGKTGDIRGWLDQTLVQPPGDYEFCRSRLPYVSDGGLSVSIRQSWVIFRFCKQFIDAMPNCDILIVPLVAGLH
jgi:hypothetical protein